jgi:hypothetical protein
MRKTQDEGISLVDAARRLAVPYQDAHRLLLTRRLEGWREGSRWRVSLESLRRLEAEGLDRKVV